jgi:nitrite reductase/ring-hydroxylating ferredoxin subunit
MSAIEVPMPLNLAGVYRRHVHASMARIWENVLDWEHLPWLHGSTFHKADLIDSGDWGWRIRLINQPGDPARAQILHLRIDRPGRRYVVSTLEGPGQGSEIRVQLTPHAEHETGVEVSFMVHEARPERLKAIGESYIDVYTLLWDEDEEMMRARECALRASRPAERNAAAEPICLGTDDSVRARLPMAVDFAGTHWRIIDLDGALTVHAALCPHWLGPLDHAEVKDGCVTCPWHGYRFDIRTGKSADGRALQLANPPAIQLRDGEVWLTRRIA